MNHSCTTYFSATHQARLTFDSRRPDRAILDVDHLSDPAEMEGLMMHANLMGFTLNRRLPETQAHRRFIRYTLHKLPSIPEPRGHDRGRSWSVVPDVEAERCIDPRCDCNPKAEVGTTTTV